MLCNNWWTACRRPTGLNQRQSASDLAGEHQCKRPTSKQPAATTMTPDTYRSAAEAPFPFFRVPRAHLPSVGNFQQSSPVLSAHLIRDADTIRRVFPEFFRLPQPGLLGPRKRATPVFGTLFSNNFVMQGCGEPLDPEPTSTAASRGGLVAVFFRRRLSSICRGMREVGATGRRPRRQSTTPGHGRNVSRTRRQERHPAIQSSPGLTDPSAVHLPARNRRGHNGVSQVS